MLLLIWGYFLKIVVADRAALFVAAVYAPERQSAWFYNTLLFCLRSGDFGGCSVMAMGTAKISDLIDNFNAPYFFAIYRILAAVAHLATWFPGLSPSPWAATARAAAQISNVLVTLPSAACGRLPSGTGLGPAGRSVPGHAALMPLRTAVVRALIDPKSRPHKLLRVVVPFVLFSSTMVFFRAYRLMDAVRIFIQHADRT